jgi:predicted peptidase
MRTRLSVVAALALLPCLSQQLPAADDIRSAMEKRVHKNDAGETLPYRLFVPKDYDKNKPYALIVFLHGAGERGDNNESQLGHAQFLRFASDEVQAKHPSIIVAPQCPATRLKDDSDQHKWTQINWSAKEPQPTNPEPSYSMRMMFEIVDALEKEFHIDPQRRYITGLSMGGYGTFDALIRRPNYWAAGVPICGGMDNSRAADIAHIPVWIFHGDKDTAVPVERSRTAVDALKKAGGEPKYTEYKDHGHFVWGMAYEEPDLVEWLFAQTAKEKP